MGRSKELLSTWVPWIGLLACCVLYLILKSFALNFVLEDDHMYHQMALQLARGRMPYRDFFFSHPPLHLVPPALLFAVSGYSLTAAQLIPNLAGLVSGIFVFLLGRRLLGRWEALIATVLFMFAFDLLRSTSALYGMNMALALLLAGTHLALSGQSGRRMLLAGSLLGLGAMTGIYVTPMALMLIVVLWLRSRRQALLLLAGFGVVVLVVSIVFSVIAGGEYWYQVIGYNLDKRPSRMPFARRMRIFSAHNAPALFCFLPGVAWGVATWIAGARKRAPTPAEKGSSWQRFVAWVDPFRGDRIGAAILLATFGLGYLFFLTTLRKTFSYYYVLLLPWGALMTAYLLLDVPRYVIGLWRNARQQQQQQETQEDSVPAGDRPRPQASNRAQRRRQQKKRRKQQAAAQARVARPQGNATLWVDALLRHWPLLVLCVGLLVVRAYNNETLDRWRSKYKQRVFRYPWRDSRFVGQQVNSWVKDLLWNNERTPTGPIGIARYLQHETAHATTLPRFNELIRKECKPGERIFGDYFLAPYAASISPCEVGARLIDSNDQRWTAGQSTPEQWIEQLERDKLGLVLYRASSHLVKKKVLGDYMRQTFPRVVGTWRDPRVGLVQLRRRADSQTHPGRADATAALD